MAADKLFELKELRDIAIVIFMLTFGFAYKFEGAATIGNWLNNFVFILFIVIFSVVVHEIVHKLVARKMFADVRPAFWPTSIIAFLVLLLASGGALVFSSLWAITITPRKTPRLGRPFANLGPREMALIAVVGPLTNLALAVLAKLGSPVLGLVAEKLVLINVTLAIFNLFPFFTLLPIIAFQRAKAKALQAPYIEGEFVFAGSRTLWVFVFFFTLVTGLGLFFFSAFGSLILAFLAAAAIWIAWHYYMEPERMPGMKSPGIPGYRSYK